MPDDTEEITCSPSTTWEWRRVKISQPARAAGTARRRRSPLAALPRRALNDTTTLTVRYRGGPECWWEIRARGVVVRRPGALALHDVLRELYGDS